MSNDAPEQIKSSETTNIETSPHAADTLPSTPQPQRKKTTALVASIVLAVVLIAGASVYAWQRYSKPQPQAQPTSPTGQAVDYNKYALLAANPGNLYAADETLQVSLTHLSDKKPLIKKVAAEPGSYGYLSYAVSPDGAYLTVRDNVSVYLQPIKTWSDTPTFERLLGREGEKVSWLSRIGPSASAAIGYGSEHTVKWQKEHDLYVALNPRNIQASLSANQTRQWKVYSVNPENNQMTTVVDIPIRGNQSIDKTVNITSKNLLLETKRPDGHYDAEWATLSDDGRSIATMVAIDTAPPAEAVTGSPTRASSRLYVAAWDEKTSMLHYTFWSSSQQSAEPLACSESQGTPCKSLNVATGERKTYTLDEWTSAGLLGKDTTLETEQSSPIGVAKNPASNLRFITLHPEERDATYLKEVQDTDTVNFVWSNDRKLVLAVVAGKDSSQYLLFDASKGYELVQSFTKDSLGLGDFTIVGFVKLP